MAEERNLGLARAPEAGITSDEEVTKEELQRRMEEARESISQTVSEIKETVTHQYHNVRESISEALDWREQFRRRPLAFSLGALSVGMILGYSVGGAFISEEARSRRQPEDLGADTDYGRVRSAAERSYAAQPITGSSLSAPSTEPAADYDHRSAVEPSRPGLLERFKETRAYDRLQEEVSALGSRFIDELSQTAQNVVLPALLAKLKDLIGVDLSTQRRQAQPSAAEQQARDRGTGATAGMANRPETGVNRTGAGYGASENTSPS
jgi:hypothetical protein